MLKLLFVNEDVGAVEVRHHLLGVGNEIRRDIATVELHALDDVELGLDALGFLDRDDTPRCRPFCMASEIIRPISASPLAEIVPTCAVSACVVILRLLALSSATMASTARSNAALQVHRVHAGGNGLGTLAHDRLGEHGRGGGPVTSQVVGLAGDFAHHLRAHVLELVGQLDLLGDRHTVLGDARCAEALVEDDVAALGAQRDFYGVGENVPRP